MNEILTDYLINPQTSILLPARELEYATIVFEGEKEFHVEKTAMQLIKEACLKYGSDYDGRRKAAMHQTGYRKRVPIPISISRDIYVFPTHAVTDYDCAWIFPRHVQFTKRNPRTEEHTKEKSMIVFHNNLGLLLDVSYHTIEKQIERVERCRAIFMENIQV